MLGGNIIWGCRDSRQSTVEAFVDGLLPSLESNLKTVASNPLGNSAGPLEGFIAIACLLGPISNIKKFGRPLFRFYSSSWFVPDPSLVFFCKTESKKCNNCSVNRWGRVRSRLFFSGTKCTRSSLGTRNKSGSFVPSVLSSRI